MSPPSTEVIVPPAAAVRDFVRRRALACFFVLAYAFSWADWLPMALTGQRVGMEGGPSHLPGLLGPMIAALVVSLIGDGFAGPRGLCARMVRLPKRALAVWLGIASPLIFFLGALVMSAILGRPVPKLEDLGLFGGIPHVGPVGVWLVLTVWNGFGEEVGWRGFALPRLQRRRSPLAAAVLLGLLWAGWHTPLFFTVETYRSLGPAVLPGFVLGIVSGSIVLSWLYNRSGGSILAVAIWHGSYNLFSGTLATRGFIAGVVSTAVTIWAVVLVVLELRALRRQQPFVIGP